MDERISITAAAPCAESRAEGGGGPISHADVAEEIRQALRRKASGDRDVAPIGLVVFALMGLAPLFGWRKTSNVSLKRAFAFPLIAAAVFALGHVALGPALGFPAFQPRRGPPLIKGAKE